MTLLPRCHLSLCEDHIYHLFYFRIFNLRAYCHCWLLFWVLETWNWQLIKTSTISNIRNMKYTFLRKGILLFSLSASPEFLAENRAQNGSSVNISWSPLDGRVYITFHTFLTTKTLALFLKSIIVHFLGFQ